MNGSKLTPNSYPLKRWLRVANWLEDKCFDKRHKIAGEFLNVARGSINLAEPKLVLGDNFSILVREHSVLAFDVDRSVKPDPFGTFRI